jgi:23S rRNA (guanine745-N1)-methyltransferase
LKENGQAIRVPGRHSHVFRCPVCGEALRAEAGSLICQNHHCFDLSRHGYVNLLVRQLKESKYDKKMFRARQTLHRSGFFAAITEALAMFAEDEIRRTKANQFLILDAGCGEGSFLAGLVSRLQAAGECGITGVGIDIVKDGIRLAAKANPTLFWGVADLARAPLSDSCCDVILNILSPANYAEFTRLLRLEGMLIKVFPGNDYLGELRALLYGSAKEAGADTVGLFEKHFRIEADRRIRYRRKLEASEAEALLQMTPLIWGAPEQNLRAVRPADLAAITVDVRVVVGRRA